MVKICSRIFRTDSDFAIRKRYVNTHNDITTCRNGSRFRSRDTTVIAVVLASGSENRWFYRCIRRYQRYADTRTIKINKSVFLTIIPWGGKDRTSCRCCRTNSVDETTRVEERAIFLARAIEFVIASPGGFSTSIVRATVHLPKAPSNSNQRL